jgi:hypothetical protein
MSCQEIDSGWYFCRTKSVYFAATIDFDIEGELARLGPTGYRPLRVRDTLFWPRTAVWSGGEVRGYHPADRIRVTHGTTMVQVSPPLRRWGPDDAPLPPVAPGQCRRARTAAGTPAA